MIKPALYDTVELLIDLSKHNLRAGMQGTLVHQHNDQAFEVEFADSQGQTLVLCPLTEQQFIVIWQAATEQAVSIIDQVAQIVVRLPQTPQKELLNFARYLSLRSVKT